MFDQYAGIFWLVLFAGLVFYALWRYVGAPYLRARFYRELALHRSDSGYSQLAGKHSRLLRRLQAGPVYAGRYRGYPVLQFAASPNQPAPTLFNRAKRRREFQAWTVTVLQDVEGLPAFCARPVKARDSMEYLFDTGNVIFPDDELLANKVHVLADDHERVVVALCPPVRALLDGIDPISLESVDSSLLLKTPRQPHDGGAQMQAALDALIDSYEAMTDALERRQISVEH